MDDHDYPRHNRLWDSLFQSVRRGEGDADRRPLAWLIEVLGLDHSIHARRFGEYRSDETTVYTVLPISIYYV